MRSNSVKSLLISSSYFPPQVGGISEFVSAIAAALGPGRVCCLTGVPANGGAATAGFPKVYRRPMAFARAKPIQALGWGATIAQIMVRERPQVVQLATAYDGYLGLWLRQWFKLPYVVYAHGNEILDAGQQEASPKPRLALQLADRVLTNSQSTARLVQKLGVDPDRIDVVHGGCDADRFRPLVPRIDLRRKLLGARCADRVILTVGTLVARKGHDTVIRALPKLCSRIPDVTYLIVGDGPYRAQLEALAVAMHVRHRVIFAGRLSAEDLPDTYALSDVFVMPSREQLDACDIEGFGLVFLEASACGKPVVAGRSGGVPEAVLDGVTGWLVNPVDPEEVANALARLLSDGELATRLGQQGRARVVHEFDWTRIGLRVEGILDSLVRVPSGQAGAAKYRSRRATSAARQGSS